MGAKKQTESVRLTDEEYQAALDELREFDEHIAESDRLAQQGTMEKAALLDRMFRDEHWIAERNAERAAFAKTPRGGRPVDPTSRSQFSTWVQGRFSHIAPRTTYKLLTAHKIATEFIAPGQITPTMERQVRPLTKLTKVAFQAGKRIEPVWELACLNAQQAGRTEPTEADVTSAISEWSHEHIPVAQARKESRFDKAERLRIRVKAYVHDFIAIATAEQIDDVIDAINADIEKRENG